MVILYNPSSSRSKKPILPLSLLALGGVLEGEFEYTIVDGNRIADDPLIQLDRVIKGSEADLLAITVMPGPQLSEAVPLCRALKHRHPELSIVWGGYFPSQHPEVCLESGYVDFVIQGHGELTFREFLKRRKKGTSFEDLPGIVFRDPESGELSTDSLPPLPDPEKLPDYPYHRIDVASYVRKTFMGRTLSHHSSYGCPFFCNFCSVVALSRGRWKAQSAARTAAIIRDLATRWSLGGIEFLDNNFFVHEGRVREFSERIRDLEIRWWGEARIDTLLQFSTSTWEAMSESGLAMVFMGAETGSDETLRRMNKGGRASRNKTLEVAERTRRHGIIPEFSFMLGSPPDPQEDIKQTLQFVRQVKRVNPASEIIFYLYTPVPLEGNLYTSVQSQGFHFPQTLEEWISPEWTEFTGRRSSRLPWIDSRMLRRLRDFEKVLNAYYPTSTDISLNGLKRLILKCAGGWRYHSRCYLFPWELRLLQKLFAYQRPETSGF